MRIVVVSGYSGSGKSSTLHLLEDEGFTCIDNLPVTLLCALIDQLYKNPDAKKQNIAIGMDARNIDSDLSQIKSLVEDQLDEHDTFEIIFLFTQTDTLIKRFSETRRRHPLSNDTTDLLKALEKEKEVLKTIEHLADITIDTSRLSLHQLRSLIKQKVVGSEILGTTVICSSFGFKYGVPIDADIMFDVRCLPNPYWNPVLRGHTGLEQPVIEFLNKEEQVQSMLVDIDSYIKKWLPAYQQNNRSYLNVAIGCTGGMHRSVFLCERLVERIRKYHKRVQVNHRQI